MSNADTHESTGATGTALGQSKKSGKFIGCLGLFLLFFFSPVWMIAFSDYIHVAGMAVAGLLAWFLLARLFGRRMSDRGAILPGMLLLAALIVLGLLMPVTSVLPCPSWCSRKVVKRADYRAMELIFNHALPPSFRITQLYYPGYNLLFNGPDGPLSAEYEAVLERRDYAVLMANASTEEVLDKNSGWPAFWYQSRRLMERFGNDWPAKYDDDRFAGKQPTPPKVYRAKCQLKGETLNVLFTVDDRSSSTVRLYVYTKVPYWMD